MSIRSFSALTAIAGLVTLAGSAQATFYSFASDNTDTLPTFVGTAGANNTFSIADSGAQNRFTLLIDDNNGASPAITLNTRLIANLTARSAGMVMFGAFAQYNYSVTGSFSFVNPANQSEVWLTINFADTANSALMTVPGNASSWGTAGAVIGADSFTAVDYTLSAAGFNAFQAALAIQSPGTPSSQYGVQAAGLSQGPDDFSFTLTRLNASGVNVAVDQQTKLPTAAWNSESSFSGSSGAFIPGPASAALCVLGGLLASRRRRA
jgi:hypothetical protein